LGGRSNVELHRAWFHVMLAHNYDVNLLARHVDVSFTRNSLQAWLYRAGLRYLYPDAGASYALGVILGVACLVLLFVLANRARKRKGGTAEAQVTLAARGFSFEYLLLAAMIPNLVVTDSEHFLWSLPIIMFMLIYLRDEHQQRGLLFYGVILAFVLYGGDWYEAWGSRISKWIETTGLLGLGNILMLLIAIYVFQGPYAARGASQANEAVNR
jgi:hypothetical protein